MYKLLPLIIGLILISIPKNLKKSTSQNGIEHLRFVEGERLNVYNDEAGHPTIGVGHKLLPDENFTTITAAQSEQLLRNDLKKAEKIVNLNVKVPLNQNQYDALVSFAFNVGAGNFKTSTLLNRLNNSDYKGALAQFPRWKYITKNGTKVLSSGLVNRRSYEQDLFNA